MKFAATAFTFVVATVPATYMSLVAVMGVVVGIGSLVMGEIVGLLLVAWAGSGIFATVCLWKVTLGCRERWLCFGLTLGVVSVFPLVMEMLSSADRHPSVGNWLIASWALALLFTPLFWIAHIVTEPD